jgi:hypothetical protein
MEIISRTDETWEASKDFRLDQTTMSCLFHV